MPQVAIVAAVTIAIDVAAAFLFRPHIPQPPPLADQLSTSQEGDPIPILYGRNRLSGRVIWSPGFTFTVKKTNVGGFFGLGGQTIRTYTYFASFAALFCEGSAQIRRVWADSKLIYDPDPSSGGDYPYQDFPPYDSNQTYNPGNQVSYHQNAWQCTTLNGPPSTVRPPVIGSTFWELLSDYAPWQPNLTYSPGDTVFWDGQIYVAIQGSTDVRPTKNASDWQLLAAYYPPPTIYPGDEAQLPDPLIQASEGVGNTPAFRGNCYAVWENFPLANFGNRIPNIRAELVSGESIPLSGSSGTAIVQSGYAYIDGFGGLDIAFEGQNVEGDILLAYACTGGVISGGGPPTISDDAGNTWNVLWNSDGLGIWWAVAKPYAKDNTVHFGNPAITFEAQTIEIGSSWTYWSRDDFYSVGQVVAYKGRLYRALLARSGKTPSTHPESWQYITQPAIAFDKFVNTGNTTPATISGDGYSASVPFADTTSPTPRYAFGLFVFPGPDSSVPPFLVAPLIINVGGNPITVGPGDPTFPAGWSDLFPDSGEQGITGTGGSSVHLQILTLGNAVPTITVDAVVQDICVRAGMNPSDVDVSLLTAGNLSPTNIVYGFALRQPQPAADALRVLAQSYFFDGVESGGKFKFVPRGLGTAMTIPESDLGLLEDKAKIKPEQVAQAHDLPQYITVLYESPLLDYQQGKQFKGRSVRTKNSKNHVILQVPLVMLPDMARQIAEKFLWLAWLTQNSYALNLWKMIYARLDPTDVIQFVYEGITFNVRITETKNGLGLTSGLNTVLDDPRNYQSAMPGGINQGHTPRHLKMRSTAGLALLDIPLLSDTHANPSGTGFYVAMAPPPASATGQFSGWPGGALYQSSDDSEFKDIASTNNPASIGSAVTALAAPSFALPSDSWDSTNTLKIRITPGVLSSDTAGNVLAGSNRLLVGEELIAFQNATDNGDGTTTVDTLLRGGRGTEWAAGTHSIGDQVVVIDEGILRVQQPASTIGSPLYYRAVTSGQNVEDCADVNLTAAGNDLKPYAPYLIGGAFDGAGNLVITWSRRTRIGGGWTGFDASPLPIAEQSELYDVDILNAGRTSVLRTFSGLTTPLAVYLAAQIVADFGSPPAHVQVNIYQRSAAMGRGFAGAGAAPATSGPGEPSAPVYPGSGGFYVNGA